LPALSRGIFWDPQSDASLSEAGVMRHRARRR
jgi:hypothetical protein